jgi:transcriptional regulator of acetoin/glycerol metabolism
MIAASVFGSARETLPPASSDNSRSTNLAEVERDHIARVLREKNGNVTHAAAALGIDRRTLQRKLRAYGMDAR